jgi:hypothetical protein
VLIGDSLPFDEGWSVVEGDLYDISSRVKEYDSEARLVREDESGALGLARYVRNPTFARGCEVLVLTVRSLDPATGQQLHGVPDARVTRHQQIADGHRIHSLKVWARRRRDGMEAKRAAQQAARSEWSRGQAHEYVWRHNRVDLGRKPFAPITKEIH